MDVQINEVRLENGQVVLNQEPAQPVNENEVQAKQCTVDRQEVSFKLRTALNLSVIGLILSVFGGLGIFFSVAGLIMGINLAKHDKVGSRYAITLGVIGAVLSVLFCILLVCIIVIALF